MSRYREPQKPGSKYITPEGARRLNKELDELWKVERPRVTQAVSEAAAQGDRSENAEYTYGKKRLREIDRRVRFLRKRLDGMVIVDKPPYGSEAGVFRGVGVGGGRRRRRCRAIGSSGRMSSNAAPGYISMDSPLGHGR